ncbi:hypothetical protein TWF694_008083 [Orbilia ellipsospora]|uniref:Uncharacterized protein n=1 Tax=Orbilia ellipsospora TaxID=2528407 RepID=A0AAV9XG09_9PEZI
MRASFIAGVLGASLVSSHGLILVTKGANGVNMPGLGVIDGTPRDCSSATCGAQADSPVIRDSDMTAGGSPLGKTSGGGNIIAAAEIAKFLKTNTKLPTLGSDNTLDLTYHQVNQDGAGPYQCTYDPTSGGTDPSAFKPCKMTQDVPGTIGGLSTVTATSFEVKAQLPQGISCTGQSGGAKNVCVLRIRNTSIAGPYGGSVAFTTWDTISSPLKVKARKFVA